MSALRNCLAGLVCAGIAAVAACSRNGAGPKDASCVRVEEGFGPAGKVPIVVDTVVTGLEVPWSLVFLPNGDWLVAERPGRLRIVRQGKLLPAIAQVPIARTGEAGLLGAVLHPEFASNRLFYVYFTVQKGEREVNRVERWRLSDDAARAERERLILDDIPAAKYHDGGRLRFGPDGKLYVGTGDASDEDLSQSKTSLAGKILRLEADGTIPADNPFGKNPAFLLGIRNTQGFDWLQDGRMVVTDHGPSGVLWSRQGHDEVNVVSAGDNLGWPAIYGCETQSGMVTPLLTWKDAAPPGGAAIYRGDAIAEWKGSLIMATLRSKHLHRVELTSDGVRVAKHEVYLQGDPPHGHGRLREVVMGPDGHLYVTTSNCDGRGECPSDKDRILRIRR